MIYSIKVSGGNIVGVKTYNYSYGNYQMWESIAMRTSKKNLKKTVKLCYTKRGYEHCHVMKGGKIISYG